MSTAKKHTYSMLTFAAFILFSCTSFTGRHSAKKISPEINNGFAVIELFTSEGCSSCPPADELVSMILAEKHKHVYVLAYHVDYWNRLGWKDVFSKAKWSARQQQYAARLGLEGVYTPQIVVNGEDEFVGSNESRLRNAVAKSNSSDKASALVISASRLSENRLSISYEATIKLPCILNIALVQAEAVTNIKRGENEGRSLHHVNIVRELETVEIKDGKGNMTLDIPIEMRNVQFKIEGFIQQKESPIIIAAAETSF